MTESNVLNKLSELGQSVWYDNISRELIQGGQLAEIVSSGVKGLTSNPSIFEKAVASSSIYDSDISDFNHEDVLDIDVAQLTVVDSPTELIASCMYAPTTAKYKVIIADEFQMLSKSSFAALLKTLEEPPPHLKFVFCTTEVRKIPVTIISRCQRFDLHSCLLYTSDAADE